MEKLSLGTQILNLNFQKAEVKSQKTVENFESCLGNKKKEYLKDTSKKLSKPKANVITKESKSESSKKVDVVNKEEVENTESAKSTKEIKNVTNKKDIKTKVKEDVLEEIAAQFNINIEELKVKLDELGIKIEDLTSDENLNRLVSAILEIEPAQLIVDSNLMEKFNTIKNNVKQVIDDNKNLLNLNNENEVDIGKIIKNYEETNSENNDKTDSKTDENNSITKPKGDNVIINNSSNQEFADALNQVVTTTKDTIIMNGKVATITRTVTAKDVFNQIVKGIKVQVTENSSNMTLKLNPQNLGKLDLSLTTQNGSITGHFIAETEAVRQVIESNLAALRNQLENQGINVDELIVTVKNGNEFDLDQNSNNEFEQKGSRKNKKILKLDNDFETEEEQDAKAVIESENSIELKA